MKKYREEFDVLPAWRAGASAQERHAIESVRLVSPSALELAVDLSTKVPSAHACHILSAWPSRDELVKKTIAKTEIDDNVLMRIMANGNPAVSMLLDRKDIDATVLTKIVTMHLEATMHWHHVRKISEHPSCNRELVSRLYRITPKAGWRVEVLKAVSLPEDVQTLVLQGDSASEWRELLRNPSLAPQLVEPLVKRIMESTDIGGLLSRALSHPGLSKDFLAGLLYSADPRLVAASADRLSEMASRIRVSDLAKHHAGQAGAEINRFIVEHVNDGLPAGYIFAALYFLRPAFNQCPGEIVKQLKEIRVHCAANMREAINCSLDDLKIFCDFLRLLPPQVARRLMVRSIRHTEFSSFVVSEVAELVRVEGCGSRFMSEIRWKRISTLADLATEFRAAKVVQSTANRRLRPFQNFGWLRQLDGANIDEFTVEVPRMTHRILRWGLSLRNCLKSHGFDQEMLKKKTVIIGLMVKGRIKYAAELSPDGTRIRQISGVQNSPAPAGLRNGLIKLIGEATGNTVSTSRDEAIL